jgi:hypothetical protein
MGQFAVDDVKVGAANTAGVHLHDELSRGGAWIGDTQELERRMRSLEDHRVHDALWHGRFPRKRLSLR